MAVRPRHRFSHVCSAQPVGAAHVEQPVYSLREEGLWLGLKQGQQSAQPVGAAQVEQPAGLYSECVALPIEAAQVGQPARTALHCVVWLALLQTERLHCLPA